MSANLGGTIERVRDLAAAGVSQAEAARRIGCSPANVSQLAVVHGISFARPRRQQWPYVKLTSGEASTYRHLTRGKGFLRDEALELVGRSDLIGCCRHPSSATPSSAQLASTARARWRAGDTQVEIAALLKVSQQTVHRMLHGHGIYADAPDPVTAAEIQERRRAQRNPERSEA